MTGTKAATRILIVESNAGISTELESRLKLLGYSVCGSAPSVEQAMALVESTHPDLVMLDLAIPGEMDGIDAAEAIRSIWNTPVVFLTTYADTDRLERAKLTYPFGYIIKPIQDRDLKITVEMALYIARADAERRRAEEALRKSERTLRAVLDAVPHHIHAKDSNGRFIMANKTIAESYHMTPEEFVGRYHAAVGMDKAEVKQMLADDKEVIETGRPKHIPEETCIDADGNVHWLETTKVPFDNDGEPAVLVVAIDITARKQAETELKASQERLKLFIDSGPDYYFLKDRDLRYQLVNKAITSFFGLNEAEILGRTDDDFLPKEVAVMCRRTDTAAMREKRTIISAEKVKGRIYETHKSPVLIDNEIVGVAGILRDITDRKRAEEALRESEEKYRLLVENANDTIFIVQDGQVKFPNPSTLYLTGYSEDDLVGKSFVDFIHPDDRALVIERHLKRLGGEQLPPQYPFRIIAKSGEILWVEINAALINWEGRPATLNFIRDISGQKQLEAQLQQAQKMEAVGTLAGGIAHDFNNLLQAINGYTQILLMDKISDNPEYTHLSAIQKAADRAAQLVRQLLLFSRKAETARKSLDLNVELEQARRMLERTIPRMIDIEIHPGSRLWTVNADPVQIEQMLLNFGSNAADAMPDGGKFIVRTENVNVGNDESQMHLGADPGNYVVLTVSDTGAGMDQDTVAHIFEPFYTTKETGKGTGLGLASVYGIVKSHGGYIDCLSSPGQGATFRVYLPAAGHVEAMPEENIGFEPLKGGKETILVVDDEASIRDLTTEALERFGYTVLIATSGEDALDVFIDPANQVDLVVLDLGMPGMGGHRCLREIQQIDPMAKIVVVSGYSVDGQIKKTLESGAKGFIAKPYQLNDLLSTIRSVLDVKE